MSQDARGRLKRTYMAIQRAALGVLTQPGELAYDSDDGSLRYRDGVQGVDRYLSGPQRSETVPACHLYHIAQPYNVTTGTNQPVAFDGEKYDTDGMHDLVTNNSRVTCVTPGIYSFTAFVEWAANATNLRNAYFRVTRAVGGPTETPLYLILPNEGTGATVDMGIAANIKLATGDYVELVIVQNSGITLVMNLAEMTAVWLGGAGNVVDQIGVPSCGWGRSTAGSIAANNAWQPISFDTKRWDTDGIHDAVNTTRFYARTPGLYTLSASYNWSNTTSEKEVCFRINGSTFVAVQVFQTGGTFGDDTISTQYNLAAGDYVELCFFIATGATAANINSSASYSPEFRMTRIGGNKTVTPRARIVRNATAVNHTAGGGSWQIVPLTAVDNGMDNDAMADVANNQLVVKTAGSYTLEGLVQLTANATGTRAAGILIKGTDVTGTWVCINQVTGSSVNNARMPVSGTYDLNVGDTIRLYAYQNSTGNLAYVLTEGGCWLSAVKNGPTGGGAGVDPGWAANGVDIQNTNSGVVKIQTAVAEPVVAALPGSPVDGQEINYLADATNGIVWRLRYRAASASAYKWEFIGGAPLRGYIQNSESKAAGGADGDLTTVGPSITLPLAGDYEYEFFANVFFTSTATSTLVVAVLYDGSNVAVNGGNEYSQANLNAPGAVGGNRAEVKRSNIIFGRTAGSAVKMRYQSTDIAASFRERTLLIRPVRVG